MHKHALVVYNPSAKTVCNPEDWLGQVSYELSSKGNYETTIIATAPSKDPLELVPLLKQPIDLVIAAGGDGTVRFTLAALALSGSKIPLAILPLGTLNVFARNLGIVEDNMFANPLSSAFNTIFHGKMMWIDLGKMNGEYFAVGTGAGPFSDAFLIPSRSEKTQFKLFAYINRLIQALTIAPLVFKITTNGLSFKVTASGVFVANVEDLGLNKNNAIHSLNDGLLDLIILNPHQFKEYLELGFHFVAGLQGDHPPCYIRKVKSATIEVLPIKRPVLPSQRILYKLNSLLTKRHLMKPYCNNKVTAMIDGEECGTTPMHIEVIPNAACVLVPPNSKVISKSTTANQALKLVTLALSLLTFRI